MEFKLTFTPRDVKTYNFELPITLNRYGKLPGLTRSVICRGLKPKFLMDPSTLEFPRRIITSIEKCYPINCEVVLSNPEKKAVQWRFDLTSIALDRVFSITPSEGRLECGQTFRVKASFNPTIQGEYTRNIPVYIDREEVAYLNLVLKGSAARPKLLFDRREVILPVVPLGVESRCSFRIINDGYENLTLRNRVFGEEGSINLKLQFPEGTNLSITKKRMRVDAVFISQKSLSFTTRVEFYDEFGVAYMIPVSGTADNCLLTAYSYMQRCAGDFRLELGQSGVMLLYDDQDEQRSEVGSMMKASK